jgi:hypothetical protein
MELIIKPLNEILRNIPILRYKELKKSCEKLKCLFYFFKLFFERSFGRK